MKATLLWGIDESKITKKRKLLGQLPTHGSHGVMVAKRSKPKIFIWCSRFHCRDQKCKKPNRVAVELSLNTILQALLLNRFAIMKTTESIDTNF